MEWSCNVSRYGRGYFRHCASIFSTVRLFRENVLLSPGPPCGSLLRRGLVMTPAVNFYAHGYCFDLIQCEKILPQFTKKV